MEIDPKGLRSPEALTGLRSRRGSQETGATGKGGEVRWTREAGAREAGREAKSRGGKPREAGCKAKSSPEVPTEEAAGRVKGLRVGAGWQAKPDEGR